MSAASLGPSRTISPIDSPLDRPGSARVCPFESWRRFACSHAIACDAAFPIAPCMHRHHRHLGRCDVGHVTHSHVPITALVTLSRSHSSRAVQKCCHVVRTLHTQLTLVPTLDEVTSITSYASKCSHYAIQDSVIPHSDLPCIALQHGRFACAIITE